MSAETLISSPISSSANDPLLGNVILANALQLILSVLYFTYNGLFTAMCAAVEWSRFALHRKGLWVSKAPTGSQRSAYFLQLPYRHSVPLMLASGALHWLVSQSIYLVYVEAGGPELGESVDVGGYQAGGVCQWALCVLDRRLYPLKGGMYQKCGAIHGSHGYEPRQYVCSFSTSILGDESSTAVELCVGHER